MGCSTSQMVPASVKGVEEHNGLVLGTPEKQLIGNAVSSSGHSVTVTEEATIKPPPKEIETYPLPEGDFIDGRLGTTDTSDVEVMLQMVAPGDYFIDAEFPPEDRSLYIVQTEENDDDGIEWKRPQELVNNPEVFVGGVHRKDVVQGEIADCWFLSSCAAVARKQKLIERVVPPNQSLIGNDYKGLIMCRFWRFGDWVTVCIDDLLPTKNGKLIYAKSENPNEFWIALLEKAYAKLHGSYQALEGGQSMDALVDLTGGIAERFDLDNSTDKNKLFNHIKQASKNGAFITASRKGDWKASFEASSNGLVGGHAYTVSGVAKVDHSKKRIIPLIRMRNPWGNEAEWNGKWSDGDEMWDLVSKDIRRRLLTDNSRDGEFWMSFDDFCKEFEEISLCAIGPDFDQDGVVDKAGMVLTVKGQWEVGTNAGGSRNNFKKYATNPQFLLTINETSNENKEDTLLDFSDEIEESIGKSQVLIGLMQEHRQSVRDEKVKMNQIGICIYETKDATQRMPLSQFSCSYDVGNSGAYINYREVICRVELSPGYYIIVPATFDPGTPGTFMVRVYSPNSLELKSLD